MIVSWQFFKEASNAWFRNHTLQFATNNDLAEFLAKINLACISSISSINVAWDNRYTGASSASRFVPGLRRCTGLHRLKVTVQGGLNFLEDKLDFVDILDEHDFESMKIVDNVGAVSSLTSLEILPGEHKLAQTNAEKERFADNLTRMRDYIMAQVALSKERGQYKFRWSEQNLAGRTLSTQEVKEYANELAEDGRFKEAFRVTGEHSKRLGQLSHSLIAAMPPNLPRPEWNLIDSTQALMASAIPAPAAPMAQLETVSRTIHSESRALNPEPLQPWIMAPVIEDGEDYSFVESSRWSWKGVALGCILFTNTACSLLALCLAIKK